MESPTYELQEDLRNLRESHAKEIAQLKATFVQELDTAVRDLCARKPADPYYMIGGQTHPTIAVSFALEELQALIDKYEPKPYKAMYGEDGNFIAWHNVQKEREYHRTGVVFFLHSLSMRQVTERCLPCPIFGDE